MFGVALFVFVGTYLILKLVDRVVGLLVLPEPESVGLDISQHIEKAYS